LVRGALLLRPASFGLGLTFFIFVFDLSFFGDARFSFSL
jgi:hypothetical protein